MSTKIRTPDGWEITGDDIDELTLGIAAVHRVLSNKPAEKRPVGRPRTQAANGDEIAAQRLVERKEKTLIYLRAIQAHPGGIPASALVQAANLSNKNSIGSAAVRVNGVLAELSIKPDLVYKWEKKLGHEKTWFPKSRMAEAIAAVENLGK